MSKHTRNSVTNTKHTYVGDNGEGYVRDGVYADYSESIYLEDGSTIYIDEHTSISVETPIIKSKSDEEHLVFGWANVSINADGDIPIDWQGDVTAPAVLEKAAYNFVLKHRTTGEMHQGDVVGHLVESVMFTKQKQEAMGLPEGTVPEGWWVGFYVPDDEVVAKIKSGEYKMFSIQGKAKKLTI